MFSVLFVVGTNCVRPRAFTERPYDILGRSNLLYGRYALCYRFFIQFPLRQGQVALKNRLREARRREYRLILAGRFDR